MARVYWGDVEEGKGRRGLVEEEGKLSRDALIGDPNIMLGEKRVAR